MKGRHNMNLHNPHDPDKKRIYIILLSVGLAFLAAFAVLWFIMCSITGKLSSQTAADRWTADDSGKYAQISVFYAESSGISLDMVYTMRVNIDKKLTENSITAENQNARSWYDGYSAMTNLTVTSSREDYTVNADADVIVTGGDYFSFHPLTLISGYYYSDDDLMQDRVVLDENLAWQLFGGTDVSGMTVLVNGQRLYVAGVVRPDSDSASSYTYGTKPHMYISYSGMSAFLGEEESLPITCYEAVIPDPVSGLASSIAKDVVTADEKSYTLVENSSRYSVKNLLSIAFDGGTRAVVDRAVVYPFWENAARITEEKAATVLVWALAMLTVPIIICLYFVFLVIHRRKAIAHKAAEKITSSAEKFKSIKSGKNKSERRTV
jgi:hypothetical protein